MYPSFLTVFLLSGFKRTLCGGKWSTLSGVFTGSSGRLGCCPAGKYMSKPEVSYSISASCDTCLYTQAQIDSSAENDDTACMCTIKTDQANSLAAGATLACTSATTVRITPNDAGAQCNVGWGFKAGGSETSDDCWPVFAPADGPTLQAAVCRGTYDCIATSCSVCIATSCLFETADGSCPDFAAKDGNGVIGDWDVSKVTDFSYSTFAPQCKSCCSFLLSDCFHLFLHTH